MESNDRYCHGHHLGFVEKVRICAIYSLQIPHYREIQSVPKYKQIICMQKVSFVI